MATFASEKNEVFQCAKISSVASNLGVHQSMPIMILLGLPLFRLGGC